MPSSTFLQSDAKSFKTHGLVVEVFIKFIFNKFCSKIYENCSKKYARSNYEFVFLHEFHTRVMAYVFEYVCLSAKINCRTKN